MYEKMSYVCDLFQLLLNRLFSLEIYDISIGTIFCCLAFTSLLFMLLFGRTFVEDYFEGD